MTNGTFIYPNNSCPNPRFYPEISVQSVKLSKRRIRYIINHRKKGIQNYSLCRNW